jgi:hypothetical protein
LRLLRTPEREGRTVVEQLAYVAGLFDGEGSVGLYQGRLSGWNFRVQLVQNESVEARALRIEQVDVARRPCGGSPHAAPDRELKGG